MTHIRMLASYKSILICARFSNICNYGIWCVVAHSVPDIRIIYLFV